MKDKTYEELAFPVLFPKGRYCYTTERKNQLTLTHAPINVNPVGGGGSAGKGRGFDA